MTEQNPREDPRVPPEQAEIVAMIRSIDEPAPARLHAGVQTLVDEAVAKGARRRGPTIGRGLSARSRLAWTATALAAVAAALVLAFTGSTTSGPTLSEASALALRGASIPAPSENTTVHAELNASVDGVAFPYWNEHFGWRASGQRVDNLYGRKIRTVFYTDAQGRRIGYSIVAGRPAPGIAAGIVHRRHGVEYHLTLEHGAPVVTWQRDGHLCIVSGRGVDPRILLALASWSAPGTLS